MSITSFNWEGVPDPYIMLDRGSITDGDHSSTHSLSSEGLRLRLGPDALQILSGAGRVVTDALQFGAEVLESGRGVFQSTNRN